MQKNKENDLFRSRTSLITNERMLKYSFKVARYSIFSCALAHGNINEYCTDTVILKIAPCANSQRNESRNSVIGTKNLKTRYYGDSESSDFRVACGIAQVNKGYGYVRDTLERLNIEPGEFCESYVTMMDRK